MIGLSRRNRRQIDKILVEIHARCRPLVVGFGGDHACGINVRNSDLVLRGIFVNPQEEWMGLAEMTDSIELENADVVLYGLRLGMELLSYCDPPLFDLLGLRPEHYLICTDEWRMILDNKYAFFSKEAIYSYNLYIERRRKAFQVMLSRREKDRKKLCVEMAQLVRFFATGAELLMDGDIVPYREAEHDLLMDIRNGKYLNRRRLPTPEYWELLDEYRGAFRGAAISTHFRAGPDRERIEDLTREIVRRSM